MTRANARELRVVENHVMEKMLVVVFEDEKKAYGGWRALRELDADGSVVVYGAAVVAKAADGKANVEQVDGGAPWLMLTGTALGSLVGVLAGPVGVIAGAAAATVMGAIPDLENARVGSDFLDDVSKAVAPGKAALVAEIDEQWTTPVDARMESLGGSVLRRALSEVRESQHEGDVATVQAELAELKAEHAAVRTERKAKLQARMDSLNARLQQKLDHATARRETIRREAAGKVDALRNKAAAARQDVRAKQEQRLAAIEKQYRNYL